RASPPTRRSSDVWMIATVVSFMSGATIIFSIPVGLAMLDKSDHKYMALGIMSGILSVPVGVFIAASLIALAGLDVRPEVSTTAAASHQVAMGIGDILRNLFPL